MKQKWRPFHSLRLGIVTLLAAGLLALPSMTAKDIQLYIEGEAVAFEVAPQIIDGRAMVPIRAIFEALGASVSWEEESRTAVCQNGNSTVQMTLGKQCMMLDNRPVYMDVSPQIVDGRLLAPARYVAECLGYTVSWEEETKTIEIEKGRSLPASYQEIWGNVPQFKKEELLPYAYENYDELDALGRCGEAMACIGQELMPTEARGAIGTIRPTGWSLVRYDVVEGQYLYNRCHLIGYQLSGENTNDRNLITGTRFLNVDGMLPFENRVAAYVKQTGNHVLYRVVPLFEGDNLLASGVTIEAESIEDGGSGICFAVFVPNYQPGIAIDYATGESTKMEIRQASEGQVTYILNTSSKKFHLPTCSSVNRMAEKNRREVTKGRDDLLYEGYSPCAVCNP